MPSPGAPAPTRLPIEDSYFELLADTLEGLDLPARGQFLQRYLRAIAHLELREDQSVQIWDVLRAAAATLKKSLRTSDSAFRIGGDEFALLLPQTDSPQALALSRRVQTVFAEMLQPLQLSVSVGMDLGVAIFPQDAEHADQLIRIADERLYQIKHANHSRPGNGSTRTAAPAVPEAPAAPAPEQASSAPQPISIETRRTPEKAETAITAAPSTSSAPVSGDLLPPAPAVFAVQRKAERVSMTGTNAYAVLGDQGARHARVLDLGFGGVAIELDSPEDLPENLLAVLHVPILPPVRVNLKPVWKQQTTQGGMRIGCAFVS